MELFRERVHQSNRNGQLEQPDPEPGLRAAMNGFSLDRIDVVVPTYNRAKTIARALDSILSQSHPVDRILVVDDGSRDNTAEVLSCYGSRVEYIRQENAGPSAARNHGVRQATAPWIAFLDSDDYWLPSKIERQVEALRREPDAVLSYTGKFETDGSGQPMTPIPAPPSDAIWPLLRYHNPVAMSSALVRRDLVLELGGFDSRLHRAEDWDLWCRLGRRGRFASVPEALTVIVETPGSLSSDVDKMLQDMEAVADKSLIADLRGVKRWCWRRRVLSAELFRGFVTVRRRHPARALSYLVRSLRMWPSPAFLSARYRSLALVLWSRVVPGQSR